MNPLLKKILAAVAVKEVFERVQEARNPKPSLVSRLAKPLTLAGLASGAAFLYRSGRLGPLVNQAKGLVGKGKNGGTHEHSSEGNGTWSAPGATSGTTSVGTSSTSTNV